MYRRIAAATVRSRLSVLTAKKTAKRFISQKASGVEKELVFPGAVRSQFTNLLRFYDPTNDKSMDTYRCVDLSGSPIDPEYNPADDPFFSQEKVIKLYKDMVTISILDTIMYDAQRQGRLSFYMVNAGEEGIAVGSAAALGKDDILYCQYREAGVFLHRGVPLDEMMNQLYANEADTSAGRQMPVHYQSIQHNIHPISSPLATQIPHAAGAAYALKIAGKEAASICYFGEGAASEGDFHSAFNIASTRSCPVVFICRNNGYAISTPTLEQYRGDGIASRGKGYGIETIRVDGNDIFAVYRATRDARKIAIEEQRPVLIETMSYRVSHHSTSDDSFAYRAKTEVEDWKRRDNPIARLRKWMTNQGYWNDALDADTRVELRKEVLKSFSKAEKLKKPAISLLFEDVYAELPLNLKEQREELAEILDTYPENYPLSVFKNGREGLGDK
ncbi:hypothetical protein CANCADRAFT_128782 [Tortispora caseinolytica NRRL Y-17796]|uniref:2-oxoisovalerate dehydrogenase subunit alpha n=1 Tax=Tortispora caseinolytica NRRL Y-17796 TaxID=767744 RepID=A0A1E4TAP4_9ASCO|nr:hypothetical protein CANCADRAFT_128782 [Tortispora caseinolytica NRRL Y-17796]